LLAYPGHPRPRFPRMVTVASENDLGGVRQLRIARLRGRPRAWEQAITSVPASSPNKAAPPSRRTPCLPLHAPRLGGSPDASPPSSRTFSDADSRVAFAAALDVAHPDPSSVALVTCTLENSTRADVARRTLAQVQADGRPPAVDGVCSYEHASTRWLPFARAVPPAGAGPGRNRNANRYQHRTTARLEACRATRRSSPRMRGERPLSCGDSRTTCASSANTPRRAPSPYVCVPDPCASGMTSRAFAELPRPRSYAAHGHRPVWLPARRHVSSRTTGSPQLQHPPSSTHDRAGSTSPPRHQSARRQLRQVTNNATRRPEVPAARRGDGRAAGGTADHPTFERIADRIARAPCGAASWKVIGPVGSNRASPSARTSARSGP
jgi:hypothetical protein